MRRPERPENQTFSNERNIHVPKNNRLLSAALIVFGAAFCSLYLMLLIWPSGWAWHEGSPASSDYFMMIAGVYATLGIFMFRAARNPAANASLIWFVVASSIVHALVMGWEAVRNPMMAGHLVGDVPFLLIIAAVLGFLMIRATADRRVSV
jgi:uncharacterized protein DUF6632